MYERSLTVGEALRFANHDFLNQLQLISMHLQMGNVDGAFQSIKEFQMKVSQTSKISKMQLPKTAEWLLTASWRFPALKLNIINECSKEADSQIDETIASYLEHTVIHVYNELDPFSDQQCTISMIDNPACQLDVHLQGKWNALSQKLTYESSSGIDIDIKEQNETAIQVIFTVKE